MAVFVSGITGNRVRQLSQNCRDLLLWAKSLFSGTVGLAEEVRVLGSEIFQNPKENGLVQSETTAEILFVVSAVFKKVVLHQFLVMLDVILLLVGVLRFCRC
jgi:hypothetical protein